MKDLPWFRQYLERYPTRKNVKESLRTPNLRAALERLHNRLSAMGLVWSDTNNSLEPLPSEEIPRISEEGEYFRTLEQVSRLSDSELLPRMDPAHRNAP